LAESVAVVVGRGWLVMVMVPHQQMDLLLPWTEIAALEQSISQFQYRHMWLNSMKFREVQFTN
jgi:hypothetical protein